MLASADSDVPTDLFSLPIFQSLANPKSTSSLSLEVVKNMYKKHTVCAWSILCECFPQLVVNLCSSKNGFKVTKFLSAAFPNLWVLVKKPSKSKSKQVNSTELTVPFLSITLKF